MLLRKWLINLSREGYNLMQILQAPSPAAYMVASAAKWCFLVEWAASDRRSKAVKSQRPR